jgi:glucokinase
MEQVVAALDVGGTSIKTGVVRGDTGGEPTVVVGPALPTLAQADAETILARLAEMADHALSLDNAVIGLAIAICGPFDLDAGESRMRGVAKFEDIFGIDLRGELRRRTSIGDRPIRFARDAESAGTGEALIGSGRSVGRVMTNTLGTGMGTCVTDHAWPVEFIDGFGVEHLAMRETPWGRADDVLSARGLAERLEVPMAELREAVDDPLNAEVVFDHGHRVGQFLAPVIDEFDVQLVVIGGGLAAAIDRFGPAIQSHLDVPVRPIALGAAGPLLGAVHLTFSAEVPRHRLR